MRVTRRDLPALPGPDRRALRRRRPDPWPQFVISPPLRVRRRPRRPVGRPGRRLARPRRDRPRPGPDGRREGRGRCAASRSTGSATARRDRDAADDHLLGGRRQRPAVRRADGRPARHDAGAALRPARKGAIEVGRDADLVLFDPAARRTIRAADLHHTSDYTPYEGLEVEGAVRSVFVRGRP